MKLEWRRSSRSGSQGGDCVELAKLPVNGVGVRDSKHPDHGHLAVTRGQLAGLLAEIRSGKYSF